jgi:hypothetical protein
LDASAAVQRARLRARGDAETFLDQHVAFADWMRQHVVDPSYRPEVVLQNGWSSRRWDRWLRDADRSTANAEADRGSIDL